MGKQWKQWQTLFSWAPKSLQMVIAAMKLKTLGPWKKSYDKSAAVLNYSVMSDSLWYHRLQPARLCCLWGFSRQEYWSGLPYPPSRGSSEPRDRTQVSLLADSLPSEPPGKPKNNRVGGLSLLQGIFLTQKSNRGLLHCRQILYPLRHKPRQRIKKQRHYFADKVPFSQAMVFP